MDGTLQLINKYRPNQQKTLVEFSWRESVQEIPVTRISLEANPTILAGMDTTRNSRSRIVLISSSGECRNEGWDTHETGRFLDAIRLQVSPNMLRVVLTV